MGLATAVELYYKPAVETLEQEYRVAEHRIESSETDATTLAMGAPRSGPQGHHAGGHLRGDPQGSPA